MKTCRHCEVHIPDHARHCPHCRGHQKRVDWAPQATLVAAAGGVAFAVLFESCPALPGAEPPVRATTEYVFIQQDLPTIARLQYDGGGDWYANPSSLPNLLAAINGRTEVHVASQPAEVRLTDPDLADYPYLYLTGHGDIRFSAAEREVLRSYLAAGGFLHADDNYGLDESFREELGHLFPDRDLVDVPVEHPIYHIFYQLPEGLPKVHEHDAQPAQGLGIFLDGRLALYYTFQSDLGDGWEDPLVHGDPAEIRESSLRMGVNLFLYALSSSPAR